MCIAVVSVSILKVGENIFEFCVVYFSMCSLEVARLLCSEQSVENVLSRYFSDLVNRVGVRLPKLSPCDAHLNYAYRIVVLLSLLNELVKCGGGFTAYTISGTSLSKSDVIDLTPIVPSTATTDLNLALKRLIPVATVELDGRLFSIWYSTLYPCVSSPSIVDILVVPCVATLEVSYHGDQPIVYWVSTVNEEGRKLPMACVVRSLRPDSVFQYFTYVVPSWSMKHVVIWCQCTRPSRRRIDLLIKFSEANPGRCIAVAPPGIDVPKVEAVHYLQDSGDLRYLCSQLLSSVRRLLR